MADNIYIVETEAPTGGGTITDDGSGIDTIVYTGAYTNILAPYEAGARIYLDGASFNGGATPSAWTERTVFYPQGGFAYINLAIIGLIENAVGGGGTDDIFGNDIANVLQGDGAEVAGGRDRLYGNGGGDTLYGMGGDDLLQGGADNDTLFGDHDPFAQQVNIAEGDDTVDGGAGDDVLSGGRGTNTLIGDEGFDTADYRGFFGGPSTSARVVVNLETNSATVYETDLFDGMEYVVASDTIYQVEAVQGADGDDSITGRSNFSFGLPGHNFLYGGYGNDTLFGGYWSDELYGGQGNDELHPGGTGIDLMVGGTGDDTYVFDYFENPGTIVEAADEGDDTILSVYTIAAPANVENVTLINNLASDATGNGEANRLTGNGANNSLAGLGGNDTLEGGNGDDTLNGGPGADTMAGGAGSDIYIAPTAADTVTEAGGLANDPHDRVLSAVSFSLATLANVEDLTLTGAAAINGNGTNADNAITGNAAANILNGGGGADRLDGGAGADTLNGGNGNDTFVNPQLGAGGDTISDSAGLHDTIESAVSLSLSALPFIEDATLTGNAAVNASGNNAANRLAGNNAANILNGGGGADTLTGGRGTDTLNGGAGADLFRFDKINTGADTIADFQVALDHFNLGGGNFSAVTESGGNTTLTHGGGTILVTGVTGLSLAEWRALIAGPSRTAPDFHDAPYHAHHGDFLFA